MFSYYGSKSKIVRYYPKPEYDSIIEPFAGSARYSLMYPDHEVTLCDLDHTIYSIWSWLINDASLSDIDRLPDLNVGDDIRDIKYLSQVERWFLGFAVSMGVAKPCNIVTKRSEHEITRLKKRTINYLPKIKHWIIKNQSFEELDNQESTWFVDPPYINGGQYYRHSQIDYSLLCEWCKERKGQTIVCENDGAVWLPFTPLKPMQGMRHKKTEMIWSHTSI